MIAKPYQAFSMDPRRSQRARIGLLFGIGALVLAAVITVVVERIAQRQMENDLGLILTGIAARMVQELDRGMFERYREIRNFATLEPLLRQNQSPQMIEPLLDQLKLTLRDYAWIGMTDSNGIVTASTAGMLRGADVSQRNWFQDARHGPFVGDVHDAVLLAKLLPSAAEPHRFVDVAVPLVDAGGAYRGVLGAHVSWSWARELEAQTLRQLHPKKVDIFIIDRSGKMIQAPSGMTNDVVPQEMLERLARDRYAVTTWGDGRAYLTAQEPSRGYRDYPGLGWTVLVREDVEQAFRPLRELRARILAWGLLLGAVFALLGWVLAGRLTRRLLALTAAADAIRPGQSGGTLPVITGSDEVARLSISLRGLVERLGMQERELRLLNEELEQRVAARTRELESANRELESFSYSVSHDLRSPLRAVTGYSQMMDEDYGPRLDAEGRRLLCVIRDNGNRMQQLIEDLLNFSRLGRKPLATGAIDMTALVRAAWKELADGGVNGVQFHSDALPAACGDAALIRQVWVNLLSNAVKFSAKREQPRVEVGASVNGKELIYRVRDNGAGFDMQYYDKLFGVFQRLHSEEEFPGTGVGLAIVQRVVSRHGGRVWAEGEIGKGATFYFSLPTGTHDG
jgi:signal transduction histidine kinase